jgi:hypothetical protein
MTPCPGALTRVSNRPHPFCRGSSTVTACALWQYGAEHIPGAIKPALIDSDGVVTCSNKVHAPTVRPDADAGNPKN